MAGASQLIRLPFPVRSRDARVFRPLDTDEFLKNFKDPDIANSAASLLVTQSQSVLQSELSIHSSQDSRALGFLAADIAAMALLPTLSFVTASSEWWWLLLLVLGLASLVMAWDVILATIGSTNYDLGPIWSEYCDALGGQINTPLEGNLEMVRQLTDAIRRNSDLFTRKIQAFNVGLAIHIAAVIVAVVVFGLLRK
jgi:hypothetical protein